MQPGVRAAIEEVAQKPQRLRQRADIADNDVKLAFLTHRKLPCMVPQKAELLEKDAHAGMECFAILSQSHTIALAVEQQKPKLPLQILNGCKYRRMCPAQPGGRRLKPALAHHR